MNSCCENGILISSQFSNLFLQMNKISDFPWKSLTSTLLNKEIDQLNIIEETVCHPQVQIYPPSTEYMKQFLKKFIYELENNGIEVNELLYGKYGILISNACQYDEEYYRTYNINKNSKIIIKEMRNVIIDGTTGLRTWQASHVLADYCLENKSSFHSKEILELGSGLGLTGLALLNAAHLKSYSFTDHHPKVLEFLKHNVNVNLSSKDKHKSDDQVDDYVRKWQDTSIEVKQLDWETPTDLKKYDVVIGADILFDKRLIPCLLDVVVKSLKDKGKAIFAATLRNEDTLKFFSKELELKGLIVDDIVERIYQESSSQAVDRIKIISFHTSGTNLKSEEDA